MLGRMPDNEALAGTGLPGSGYGDVLWEPSPEVVERARVTDYRRWLAARGVSVGGGAARGAGAGWRRPRRETAGRPRATTTGSGNGRSTSRPRSGARSGTTSACSASAATGRC